MGNSAKRDAREIATTERQRQALELRLAGLTYDEIARKLGVHDRSSARTLVLRGIEKYRQRRDDAAEDLVEKILEDYAERKARCRALMTTYYPKAVRGDMKAAALLLDAQKDDRENDRDVRRMLGLDAPTKTENSGAPLVQTVTISADNSPENIAAAVRSVFGAHAAVPQTDAAHADQLPERTPSE